MMRVGRDWLLLPQRIAVHSPSATAVLADVHLGYTAARQRLGDAVPLRTPQEELQPLIQAASLGVFTRLVVAGDLFEQGFDAECWARFAAILEQLKIEFVGLVPGNHDRRVEGAGIPILSDAYRLGGWAVAHGEAPARGRAILGHWHPAVHHRGRKRPCFLVSEDAVILPAFSLDAAGADIRRNPRWAEHRCCVIWQDRVLELPRRCTPE